MLRWKGRCGKRMRWWQGLAGETGNGPAANGFLLLVAHNARGIPELVGQERTSRRKWLWNARSLLPGRACHASPGYRSPICARISSSVRMISTDCEGGMIRLAVLPPAISRSASAA